MCVLYVISLSLSGNSCGILMEVSIETVMAFGMMPSLSGMNPLRNTLVLCADVSSNFDRRVLVLTSLGCVRGYYRIECVHAMNQTLDIFLSSASHLCFESKRLGYFTKSSINMTAPLALQHSVHCIFCALENVSGLHVF